MLTHCPEPSASTHKAEYSNPSVLARSGSGRIKRGYTVWEPTKQEVGQPELGLLLPTFSPVDRNSSENIYHKNNHTHNSKNKKSQHQLAGRDEGSLENNWFAIKTHSTVL